jgi:hypothetical protein
MLPILQAPLSAECEAAAAKQGSGNAPIPDGQMMPLLCAMSQSHSGAS